MIGLCILILNDFLRQKEEYLIRAGLLRKEWKDSDCHKTVIQTAGGGREGIRGGIQRRRKVWLWSWCCLGGMAQRLSVVGSGEGNTATTILRSAGSCKFQGL